MTSGPDKAVAARELELVTDASRGDAAAFDRFFERHAGGVQLLVERLLGPGEVADGVVAEAFEKTVRRLPLLGSRNSSPGIYVLSTARNGAYAALGRHRPQAEQGPLAALLRLPSRQRELLALREIGLSCDECAEVAGVEPGEAGAQIARARLLLVDELEGESLSKVFADPRAERLLGAEVTRPEGAALDPALAAEIDALADTDERFAAALSAVRSPGRSTGRLQPATGSRRLAAVARTRAIGGAAAGGAAPAAHAPAAAPPAGPESAQPAPPAAAVPAGDEYDDVVGDEAAWGIIDDEDFELEPLEDDIQASAPQPAEHPESEIAEPDTRPGEAAGPGSAEDDVTRVASSVEDDVGESEDPTALVAPVQLPPAGPAGPAATWSSAEDWDDADAWGSTGEVEAVAAPAPGLGDETVAFDAVAAGLADPESSGHSGAGGAAAAPPHDDREAGRRGRPGWLLLMLLAFALFAAAAGVAYFVASAGDDPDPVPATTDQPLTTTVPDAGSDASPTTGSSDAGSGAKRSSGSGAKPAGATTGTRPASSTSAGSGATGSGRAAPSSGTAAPASPGGGGGNPSERPASEPTVEGGESSSGGAVRTDASGTTP